MYITRTAEKIVQKLLNQYPIVAILGPRQCGKSTLAQYLLSLRTKTLYLDLELPSDLRKLNDPEQFLSLNSDYLICLDEVQRKPDLFPILRALSDRAGRPGQFLILGSSSPELLKQSSESLAGRISYFYLTPFQVMELGYENMHKHWYRGGFPGSWLAKEENQSKRWLNDFILTYLEKDIPSLGFQISINTIRRLWGMLAHSSGQIANKAKLAESLGISSPTVQNYVELLEKTFMSRILYPFHTNLKKRLIKSPKFYIRDTGVLHALLEIDSINSLMGHPSYGQSWESYALEQVISSLPGWHSYFYRTSDGTEIDLLLVRGQQKIALEFKASTAPKVGAGFFHAIDDLKITKAYIVSPFLKQENYPYNKIATAASLDIVITECQKAYLPYD